MTVHASNGTGFQSGLQWQRKVAIKIGQRITPAGADAGTHLVQERNAARVAAFRFPVADEGCHVTERDAGVASDLRRESRVVRGEQHAAVRRRAQVLQHRGRDGVPAGHSLNINMVVGSLLGSSVY